MISKLNETSATNQYRRELKMIFKKRILDDQYKINSEKNYIRKILACEFKEEYRSVLTKMLRFCNYIGEDKAQVGHMDFDKDILDFDIIPLFAEKGFDFQNMAVEPMDEEVEKYFAKLFS